MAEKETTESDNLLGVYYHCSLLGVCTHLGVGYIYYF